jgi:predicted SprT family Zn-dependent metalloprotease
MASIELSTKVLDRPARLRATLAHEMCHVAAWLVDGVARPPHGAAFRRWANRVTRHARIDVTTCHRYAIAYRHRYQCTNPACLQSYGRHSKSIDVRARTVPALATHSL